MRTSGLTPRLVLAALVATVVCGPTGSHVFAAEDCPKEKRRVCIEETLGGHTFKHPAYTNECLAAKFGGKIVNEGDCAH